MHHDPIARGMADGLARKADFERARFGTPLAMILSLLGATLAAMADHPALGAMLISMCVVTSSVCAVCWRRLLQRGATAQHDELVMAVLLSTCALLGVAALGPLTASVAFLFPLVYAFGLNRSETLAWSVWGTCALGYALLAAWLPIATPRGVATTLAVEVVLFGTFLHAQRNRQALTSSMARVLDLRAELERASAELAEAREDVELAVEAPRIGTLTGKNVGPFQVGEVIGRGGMGEVYRAWKGEAAAPVALKVMPRSLMHDAGHIQRFLREAKQSSRLDCRHIVKVHEVGCTTGGTPYLAMDLLRGRDLGQILDKRDRLSLRETAQLVRDVCKALDTAHAAGIIHRDIKPENVFLSTEGPEPCWKVLDFGVCTVLDSNGTLTQGGIVGTAGYLSPEQARGERVDHRTDIFALGAIAYRALTGEPAFHAQDTVGAILQVIHLQPIDPKQHVAIPDDVCLALAIALAKDKGSRFASGEEMCRVFSAAARSELTDELRTYARALLAELPWTEAIDDSASDTSLNPALAAVQIDDPRTERTPDIRRWRESIEDEPSAGAFTAPFVRDKLCA